MQSAKFNLFHPTTIIRVFLLCSLVFLLSACQPTPNHYAPFYPSPGNGRGHLMEALAARKVQVIEVGSRLRLVLPADDFFKHPGYQLNPQARETLATIAELLKYYPQRPIVVSGHSDNVGSELARLERSQRLAQVVASYLGAEGIPLQQMTVIGEGNQQPVSSSCTLVGCAANRRVEIRVY